MAQFGVLMDLNVIIHEFERSDLAFFQVGKGLVLLIRLGIPDAN